MKLKMEKMGLKLLRFKWIILLFLFSACNNDDTKVQDEQPVMEPVYYPTFNADSAYTFVANQVDFGPRYPGSKGHYNAFLYLRKMLTNFCDTVYIQSTRGLTFDKKDIPIYNLVGVFNPKAEKRIILAAHWDTRPFADEDDSAATAPILGANDGGSGVVVLLEIARLLKESPLTNIGIDIIFFDAEDWGKGEVENSFCLGSQYWAKNPHIPSYTASYGILLDMVGAKNAVFAHESYSTQVAPDVVKKVWDAAGSLGYTGTFMSYDRGFVIDDHYYVNRQTNIPMIDIIQHDPTHGFGEFWHTHDDNMSVIDKQTLEKVGKTLIKVLYDER